MYPQNYKGVPTRHSLRYNPDRTMWTVSGARFGYYVRCGALGPITDVYLNITNYDSGFDPNVDVRAAVWDGHAHAAGSAWTLAVFSSATLLLQGIGNLGVIRWTFSPPASLASDRLLYVGITPPGPKTVTICPLNAEATIEPAFAGNNMYYGGPLLVCGEKGQIGQLLSTGPTAINAQVVGIEWVPQFGGQLLEVGVWSEGAPATGSTMTAQLYQRGTLRDEQAFFQPPSEQGLGRFFAQFPRPFDIEPWVSTRLVFSYSLTAFNIRMDCVAGVPGPLPQMAPYGPYAVWKVADAFTAATHLYAKVMLRYGGVYAPPVHVRLQGEM